jgi:hypothetical protein
MENEHIISALKRKRAEIGGQVREFDARLKALRVSLINIDATLKLFAPHVDPTSIAPKRTNRRSLYFGHNELHRLTLSALRVAAEPITSRDIAGSIMTAKGIDAGDRATQAMIAGRVASQLRELLKRGTVTRIGEKGAAKWALPGRAE